MIVEYKGNRYEVIGESKTHYVVAEEPVDNPFWSKSFEVPKNEAKIFTNS